MSIVRMAAELVAPAAFAQFAKPVQLASLAPAARCQLSEALAKPARLATRLLAAQPLLREVLLVVESQFGLNSFERNPSVERCAVHRCWARLEVAVSSQA